MLPQIFFFFFNRCSEIFFDILRVLVVSSKREVYTARHSFIWVVKQRGEGDGCGISYYFVCTIFLY